jgi:predicted permease
MDGDYLLATPAVLFAWLQLTPLTGNRTSLLGFLWELLCVFFGHGMDGVVWLFL